MISRENGSLVCKHGGWKNFLVERDETVANQRREFGRGEQGG